MIYNDTATIISDGIKLDNTLSIHLFTYLWDVYVHTHRQDILFGNYIAFNPHQKKLCYDVYIIPLYMYIKRHITLLSDRIMIYLLFSFANLSEYTTAKAMRKRLSKQDIPIYFYLIEYLIWAHE